MGKNSGMHFNILSAWCDASCPDPYFSAGNQETTINALYALDPANNGGNDFQYEEVVRDKQKRKHMHAGDCECCRDVSHPLVSLPCQLLNTIFGRPVLRRRRSTPAARPSPAMALARLHALEATARRLLRRRRRRCRDRGAQAGDLAAPAALAAREDAAGLLEHRLPGHAGGRGDERGGGAHARAEAQHGRAGGRVSRASVWRVGDC